MRGTSITPQGADRDTFTGDAAPKVKLFLKCENQQKIGAFKARGAFYAVSRLIEEQGLEELRRIGVVTHSSGKSCPDLSCRSQGSSANGHRVLTTFGSKETMPRLSH